MILLAKKPIPGEPFDWLMQTIVNVTHGAYCHTEIRFADGRMLSSTAKTGVRWLSAADADFELRQQIGYWDAIGVPWKETPELLSWCETEVQANAGYDFEGALKSALGEPSEDPTKWFCSEISAAVLGHAGAMFVPRLPHPSALVSWALLNGGTLNQK